MTEEWRTKIVWIDDDQHSIETQVARLKLANYDVTVMPSVDEAYKTLSDPECEIQCVVLDIMMATGSLLKGKDTEGGLKTGAEFLRFLSSEGLFNKFKWIIYTITDNEDTWSISNELNVPIYKKQNYPGKSFIEVIVKEFEGL